jgi:hypothetical protein
VKTKTKDKNTKTIADYAEEAEYAEAMWGK